MVEREANLVRERIFWGAHAARVLVAASRRNDLSEKNGTWPIRSSD